ncbi:MAG TPA: AMP-binding protein, partial [Ktedonobacteraceae bacterium]|nr:AMP-binding protein [Ktedonobacteraceae bacterium]
MSSDQFIAHPLASLHAGSIVELIQWRAIHQPERTAFTFLTDGDDFDRLTYAELNQRAWTIARALQARIGAGERAILLYQPSLDYITAFLGCLYAQIIAVPAYLPLPHRPPTHLQAIARDANASLLLSTTLIQAYLQHLFEAIPELVRLNWLLTDTLVEAHDLSSSSAQILDQAPATSLIDSHKIAFLQYTSGSTSSPRGVMVSHANLLANLEVLHKTLVPPEENLGMSWLPPYHDMGLIGGILLALYSGIETFLMSPISFLQQPRKWLEAISRTKSTISGGPNFAYELCVRKIPPEQRIGLDLSHWQVAAVGAEPVRASTLREFSTAFAQCGFRQEAFYPCYGLAEATLMVSSKRPMQFPVIHDFDAAALEAHKVVPVTMADHAQTVSSISRTLVSSGQAVMGQHIEIVGPDSRKRCASTEIGEIWVQGPSVAQGYWNQPASTDETFHAYLLDSSDSNKGPFLRTGDLGFFHQGELYITGRLKDLIIIHGRNHYPQDLELTAQHSHSLLRPGGGAAFSIEQAGEERLVIIHELGHHYQQRETALDEVIEAIRRTIWEHHELEVYAVALLEPGSIYKTSSGKIQRSACRHAFLNGELKIVQVSILEARKAELARQYVAPRNPGEELLATIWGEVLGMERVGIHDNFFDLGGHSLVAAQIASRIHDTFQLELTPGDLFEAQTIA